ncbi:MAG TPA: EVE domain-containing protein [Nitrospira sp.]|nr:EVE domain-containing protein [Nitrospira sp.]
MRNARRYWLVKSEPEAFSIDDLARAPRQTTCWDGVRNYQARNFMREMAVGDLVLFYHSNADPPAVVGSAEVVKTAYPDDTQFDKRSDHYDPASTRDCPRWEMVDLKYREKFVTNVPLDRLRREPRLRNMVLLRKGSRLSVQPVTASEWAVIMKLAGSKEG